MLDLEQIHWRRDSITRRYLAAHEAELTDPSSMSSDLLALTTTYCQNLTNPYAEELAKRAGLLEKYLYTADEERADIVRQAAKGFNIVLI